MSQESSSWLGNQPNRQPSEHLIRCHTSSSLAYLFLCLGPVRVKLEFCCQWKADSWSPRGWTCPSFSCLGGHSCVAVSCSLNRKEGGKVQQRFSYSHEMVSAHRLSTPDAGKKTLLSVKQTHLGGDPLQPEAHFSQIILAMNILQGKTPPPAP